MNRNKVTTDTWSNPTSGNLYKQEWSKEPDIKEQYQDGQQCGGCSFFAPFNADWGLCCNKISRHFTETVFEHFTCPNIVDEGWGPHSFMEKSDIEIIHGKNTKG